MICEICKRQLEIGFTQKTITCKCGAIYEEHDYVWRIVNAGQLTQALVLAETERCSKRIATWIDAVERNDYDRGFNEACRRLTKELMKTVWVCEFCYHECRESILPDTWDFVWQAAVCPQCQKRVQIDGGYNVVKGGSYAGIKRDPRYRNQS